MSEQASSEGEKLSGEYREMSRRIWELEHALARSEDACTAAIRETFVAREQAIELQKRVDELGGKTTEESEGLVVRQDDHNKIAELESALKVVLTERDEALRTMCEIKRLLDVTALQ
jgi:hypothetical protein